MLDTGPQIGRTRPVSITRSHVGLVRQVNEDRVLSDPDRGLWAVADGMGGHSGGDVAAEIAIATLRDLAPGEAVEAALHEANRAIRSQFSAQGQGGGSTIVALSLAGDRAIIVWAGDSRAYRLHEGQLELLTHDHSLVQGLVDAGALAADRADAHPQAHIITRALGAADTLDPDRIDVEVQAGDHILLCSDGLSREVDEATIADLLGRPIGEAADALMASALAAGGHDNISFVLIAF